MVSSDGTEEFTESLACLVGAGVLISTDFSVISPLEILSGRSTSSEGGKTFLGEKGGHLVKELVGLAVSVKSTDQSDIILQDKLALWDVPRHVDLGQNVEQAG